MLRKILYSLSIIMAFVVEAQVSIRPNLSEYAIWERSPYEISIDCESDSGYNRLLNQYIHHSSQKNDTIYTFIRDWSFELLFSEKNPGQDILGTYKRNNKYFFIRTFPENDVSDFLHDNFIKTNDSTDFKFKDIIVPDSVFIVSPDVSTAYHGYYADNRSTTILFQYFDKNMIQQRNKHLFPND